MKKITIGIIIGIIISCTVGVLASTIVPSTIVTYQDKTLNTALDELYDSVNLLKTRGDAEASQILTGKKAIVKGIEITGTMANRGNLNWTPSTGTSYTVPSGYYSGGTLNSSGAYNTGYSAGVTAADNRANANSTNYKTGYNAGYSAGKSTSSGAIATLTGQISSGYTSPNYNVYRHSDSTYFSSYGSNGFIAQRDFTAYVSAINSNNQWLHYYNSRTGDTVLQGLPNRNTVYIKSGDVISFGISGTSDWDTPFSIMIDI